MTRSVIAAGLQIVGDLKCRNDLLVEGSIEGSVEARDLTIADGARIDGSVMARTAHIQGALTGNLGATRIVVGKTGRLRGEVLYQTLSVEPGATVEAQFQNLGERASISDEMPGNSEDIEIPPVQEKGSH